MFLSQTRLSSLLKTAEDLHIKGLAEVSWRSDGGPGELSNSGHHSPGSGGAPGVETVLREGLDSDEQPPPTKQRRRGRPPLDETPTSAHDVFSPKITCITGNVGNTSYSDTSTLNVMIGKVRCAKHAFALIPFRFRGTDINTPADYLYYII